MVSGGCCGGALPDTVCWTQLRNTWITSLTSPSLCQPLTGAPQGFFLTLHPPISWQNKRSDMLALAWTHSLKDLLNVCSNWHLKRAVLSCGVSSSDDQYFRTSISADRHHSRETNSKIANWELRPQDCCLLVVPAHGCTKAPWFGPVVPPERLAPSADHFLRLLLVGSCPKQVIICMQACTSSRSFPHLVHAEGACTSTPSKPRKKTKLSHQTAWRIACVTVLQTNLARPFHKYWIPFYPSLSLSERIYMESHSGARSASLPAQQRPSRPLPLEKRHARRHRVAWCSPWSLPFATSIRSHHHERSDSEAHPRRWPR